MCRAGREFLPAVYCLRAAIVVPIPNIAATESVADINVEGSESGSGVAGPERHREGDCPVAGGWARAARQWALVRA